MLLTNHVTPWLQVNLHLDLLLARLKAGQATETHDAARHHHGLVSRLGCDNGMIQIWTTSETPHGGAEQSFIGW